MKKYMLPSLLFIIGLAIGIGGTNYYKKTKGQGSGLQLMEENPKSISGKSMDDFYNEFFDDEFLKENKFPFKQMEKMKESMSKLFEDDHKGVSSNEAFDSWYKNRFGDEISDVKQEEDKKSIYYKLRWPDINKENVNVEVHDGVVNVSAKSERSEEKEEPGAVSKSSFVETFERRLPVPPGTDGDNVYYKFDEDYLVIHFPKLNKRAERIL